MYTKLPLILSIFSVTLIPPIQAADVLLFDTPDEDGAIVARINSEAPLLKKGKAVLAKDKAKQGWKWVQYPRMLTGYIPTYALSKNFEIAQNTQVHSKPSASSQILTSTGANSSFEITALESNWATVRFTKTTFAYYIEAPVSPIIVSAPPTPLKVKKPIVNQAPPEFDPNKEVGQLAPDRLPEENVIWSVGTNPPKKITPLPTDAPIVQIPAKPKKPTDIIVALEKVRPGESIALPPADAPLRSLSGVLNRQISENTESLYPLRLNAPSGKRIAYVDISQVFIPDLRPYLGQQVNLHGEVYPLDAESEERIIFTRTIHLAD